MKIGYEAKRAFLNMTGLGNYSRELIRIMASNFPDNQYFLYTPKVKSNNRLAFLSQLKNVVTVTPGSKLFTSFWRSKGVVKDLKRDGIELYHGLSHELPIGIAQSGIKSVVTIHDLIFMRFPQYFGFVSRKIYRAKINYACKNADRIIAISKKTKDDLVELLGIDPAKIAIVYQGCDDIFKILQTEQQRAEVKLKYKLPANFILNVGTIEPRKNLMLLIDAMVLLPDVNLVVIGKQGEYFTEIDKAIKKPGLTHISFLNNVDFADLPAIYQMADVFVYPSRYEGFGIPILEALVSGTPVIAATGSCLEEAGGPGSIYVEPDNEVELAKKIQEILNNKPFRDEMVEKGLIYSRNFDEIKLAAQLMQIYQNTVGHA